MVDVLMNKYYKTNKLLSGDKAIKEPIYRIEICSSLAKMLPGAQVPNKDI